MIKKLLKSSIFLFLQLSFLLQAQEVKVLANQVGYEPAKAKRAIVMADRRVAEQWLPHAAWYLLALAENKE